MDTFLLRIFDTLANFLFPASEIISVIISNKYGIYELPRELHNNLRLRILEIRKDQ